MRHILDFEKPIYNLREQINELSKLSIDSDINLEEEIATLERRLARLEKDIYTNLRPWNRVQIARHQLRPTTLDYIQLLFDDFIEFHGDRFYGDDAAIISGVAYFFIISIEIVGYLL